ncbi:hypothetical protein ACFSHR_04845 [Azotobacter chroococcum]
MALVSTAWHVISALLVFLAGALLITWAGRHFGTGSRRSLALYAWHTLFCLVYCWYVLKYGGDAIGYYRTARGGTRYFHVGTYGVVYLTRLLIEGLGFPCSAPSWSTTSSAASACWPSTPACASSPATSRARSAGWPP